MNNNPPPSKRIRVDPNAMDDEDDTLPPKGQSVLGKRKRKDDNKFLYGDSHKPQAVEKSAPSHHPNGTPMKPEEKGDDESNANKSGLSGHSRKIREFLKGHQLDIKVTDEHNETFWTSGIICKIKEKKILIHVPRVGPQWKEKTDADIAPSGTYTDGLN